VQDVEVTRLLGQDLSRRRGVAVDKSRAVERREQPLVRVDHETVGVADAFEQVSVRRREERRATVGAVDVEPQLVFVGVGAESLEVVHDAGVGRARVATTPITDSGCGSAASAFSRLARVKR